MVRGKRPSVPLLWTFLLGCAACSASRDPLAEMLAGRGRVLLAPGFSMLADGPVEGSEPVPWGQAPASLRERLRGASGEAAARALRDAAFAGLLLKPGERRSEKPIGVAERLASGVWVPGWRGVRLRPEGLLFEPAERHMPGDAERGVIARVARGILEGRRPPRITSFPEPWRRIRSSEVMVAVRSPDGTLRLWRSARASSMARALLTAASVARQRWMEREEALGGPIEEVLPRMRVEVASLWDDGTLEVPSAAFVDRMVRDAHGVGFEQGGGWHYVLPESLGERRPFEALLGLLERRGLGRAALERTDLRVYRFVVFTLGVSEPDALLR